MGVSTGLSSLHTVLKGLLPDQHSTEKQCCAIDLHELYSSPIPPPPWLSFQLRKPTDWRLPSKANITVESQSTNWHIRNSTLQTTPKQDEQPGLTTNIAALVNYNHVCLSQTIWSSCRLHGCTVNQSVVLNAMVPQNGAAGLALGWKAVKTQVLCPIQCRINREYKNDTGMWRQEPNIGLKQQLKTFCNAEHFFIFRFISIYQMYRWIEHHTQNSVVLFFDPSLHHPIISLPCLFHPRLPSPLFSPHPLLTSLNAHYHIGNCSLL